jgi:hypothetical protein
MGGTSSVEQPSYLGGRPMERCFVGKIDWLNALDLKQAVENIKNEIPGDWYQDPWGWPELGFMLQKQQEFIAENLNASGVGAVALLDVPKENWEQGPPSSLILRIA